MSNQKIISDKYLIAKCGLYCAACTSFLKCNCLGCNENVKATWCKVRSCCIENDYFSCSDCKMIDLKSCNKYNNFVSKTISFFTRSDRSACIKKISEMGYHDYANLMARYKRHAIKRK